ncbi:peptidoglycan editing factor PgeF [Candidatus Nitrotoga arctica]|uniref:Purine nucleoside phosphorylase n=1 Tax=Candidatus Nitrotoga arctica TaxID=453162 RepID=A0ABM8YXT1_9PROT|nr:peptidoglycan editing factor PgeF [Candidatus Nitrotoga arctica]CAG9932341.1 polyphenol oxidase YfiH [Candidatus Nitrotoga arctica]
MNLLEHCIIPDWPAPKNIRTLQTTRNGGISAAPYNSLNLSSNVGDAPLAVARNRMLLEPMLPSEPVWLKQVHGVVVTDAAQAECWPEADACVSTHPGAVCVVMTADCLPVLLCNDKGSVISAVHAGWRGLCDGVIEHTVRAMDVPPNTLMAWLGPAIGPRAFEVGDEVRAEFIGKDQQAAAAFVSDTSGKWFADIYQLAGLRLNALGVTRVYGGGLCTYTDSANFFSYRRDSVTGRMGTFIWLDK